MHSCYRTDAPKKPVNLSLNSDLMGLGKSLGLNLSRLAEEALAQAVRQRLAETWLQENREAIEAFNEHVERQGTFSDGLRSF